MSQVDIETVLRKYNENAQNERQFMLKILQTFGAKQEPEVEVLTKLANDLLEKTSSLEQLVQKTFNNDNK